MNPFSTKQELSSVGMANRANFINQYGVKPSEGEHWIGPLVGLEPENGKLLRLRGEDHSALWEKDGVPYMYTFQPYNLDTSAVSEIAAFCKTHALELTVDARPAWHNPGRTLLVVIKRKGI